MQEGVLRRESRSFMSPVNTAVISGDDACDEGDDMRSQSGCRAEDAELEGWTFEKGRFVRTFSGEIPLRADMKPSFVFSHFVLKACVWGFFSSEAGFTDRPPFKYAVVLFPFDAPGFSPSSIEPLWSEQVVIATHPARFGPEPVAASQQMDCAIPRSI